jgi:hypothetical protein
MLVRKPHRERLLGYLGMDGVNIKMDINEIGCEGVDWV